MEIEIIFVRNLSYLNKKIIILMLCLPYYKHLWWPKEGFILIPSEDEPRLPKFRAAKKPGAFSCFSDNLFGNYHSS